MKSSIVLKPGWWCWLEVPVLTPGWGASPVFVQQVEPLKTGKGLLHLSFIQAVHPVAAQECQVVLRVVFRAGRHLVGTLEDDAGNTRTVILAAPDYNWLETYCPLLLLRRPPAAPNFFIVDKPAPSGSTAADYLDTTFGRTAPEILRGACASSFACGRPPMPALRSHFTYGRIFCAFDSWMIARGFVPTEMEEKWFIYMKDGRLLFRRSWTGIVVYDVEAVWRGDQLYLGQVRVNRNPEQYSVTDDDYDRRLLNYLIAAVLLGENASFPTEGDLSPDQTSLQAWSWAGKASL